MSQATPLQQGAWKVVVTLAVLFPSTNALGQVVNDLAMTPNADRWVNRLKDHAITQPHEWQGTAQVQAVSFSSECGWFAEGAFPGLTLQAYASAVFDDGSGEALYVAGHFTMASGVEANNIAKWDGSKWTPLETGTNGQVYALEVFDDGEGPALYAGGRFTLAGNISANNIAKWDGNTWSPLGGGVEGDPGFFGTVFTLTVFDDGSGSALYAGGEFTTAGGIEARRIARWDGSNWSALGEGLIHWPYALTVFDGGDGLALYAGGMFLMAGNVNVNFVAKWNGEEWSPVGDGMSGPVYALEAFDDGFGTALYAGGEFSTAGGVNANNVARWDGSTWSALGTGMGVSSPIVRALTVFDDGGGPALYAGGGFTSAGGIGASHIARWDGSTWSALGTGMGVNSDVYALTVFDDGGGPALYAGGAFGWAGGVNARRIAKWNGVEWFNLTTKLDNPVLALTVFDDGNGPALFAGGTFTSVAGISLNHIAKKNGDGWAPLSTGMNGNVLALTVFDDGGGPALYAGGDFTTAGGVTRNRIAKWNGNNWSALGTLLGTGVSGRVNALAVFDDGGGPALYAGGSFTTAGGVSANYIAKWDGTTWSALGTGLDSHVLTLAVFDDGGGPALYAGGIFTTAGGVSANRIAKWNGAEWSVVDTGVSGSHPSYSTRVFALSVFDDGGGPALYAAGHFSTAGGVSVNHIARWDGSTWSALGTGLNGTVRALAVFDDGVGPALYAGGAFWAAGEVSARRIAKWNGYSWTTLGTGILGGDVLALAVFDDGFGAALYAGGDFTTAGGVSSPYIARWSCPGNVTKNRFLTIAPQPQPGIDRSLEVCILSMPQFPAREGECWWAGPVVSIPNAPDPSLAGAFLECTSTPHAEDWSSDPLHLVGAAIIPGSTYEVRICDADGIVCSDPLLVDTGKWGDVVTPFGPSQPNFGDVSAILDGFRGVATAPIVPRIDLIGSGSPGAPNEPNLLVNFGDVSASLDAFRGLSYPFTVPACP
jgi:trimeric autotransporter adhesin